MNSYLISSTKKSSGNTIFTISEKYPIVYGASSIFLALVAGVAASFIRKKLSQWRAARLNKPAMY